MPYAKTNFKQMCNKFIDPRPCILRAISSIRSRNKAILAYVTNHDNDPKYQSKTGIAMSDKKNLSRSQKDYRSGHKSGSKASAGASAAGNALGSVFSAFGIGNSYNSGFSDGSKGKYNKRKGG